MKFRTASAAVAGGERAYEWRISFSALDGYIQTAADFPALLQVVHLWYGCNVGVPPGGMAALDSGGDRLGGWSRGLQTIERAFNCSGANLKVGRRVAPWVPSLRGDCFVTALGAARLGLSITPSP